MKKSTMYKIGGVGGVPGDEITRGMPRPAGGPAADKMLENKRPPKKKPMIPIPQSTIDSVAGRFMGGGNIDGYKRGSRVRGSGLAKRGVRPAKMVR